VRVVLDLLVFNRGWAQMASRVDMAEARILIRHDGVSLRHLPPLVAHQAIGTHCLCREIKRHLQQCEPQIVVLDNNQSEEDCSVQHSLILLRSFTNIVFQKDHQGEQDAQDGEHHSCNVGGVREELRDGIGGG